MAKQRKLTIKQLKFLKEYIKTGNGTKSAMKVYDTTDYATAASIAKENLKKPQFNEAIQSMMEIKGVSLGKIVQTVAKGMEAKKVITSHTEPDYEYPDHAIRLKAADMAAKWTGVDKNDAPNVQVNMQMNFT